MTAEPGFPLLCPLCGGANACAPAQSGRLDDPCWCRAATFTPALLARIPPTLRDVACVCAACAAADAGARAAPS